jgi:pimeloyl-ACP methyl ester carboxylesterase
MKQSIDSRELFVLYGPDTAVRGTLHKTSAERSGNPADRIETDRVGVLFLNSTSPTRAANGDTAVYLAESVAQRGYPSLRIDFPGFGDSGGDPPAGLNDYINKGGFAAIASAKIKELEMRFNLKGVVIVGHCAGAVSAIFAAAASEECRGLVLMGPYFHLPQSLKPLPRDPASSRAASSQITVDETSTEIDNPEEKRHPSLAGEGLPDNANVALLNCWKKVASAGVPILLLKGPDRKASDAKLKAGEFDYLEYLLRSAGPRGQVTIKEVEGSNQAFANRQGRMAVRQETEEWLQAYFPLAAQTELDWSTVQQETG